MMKLRTQVTAAGAAALVLIGLTVGSFGIGYAAGNNHHPAAVKPTLPVSSVLLERSGTGVEQTPIFKTSDHWNVAWQSTAGDYSGQFTIEVYDATTRQLAGLIGNVLVYPRQTLQDTSYGHRGASYYLSISGTNCTWHITVTSTR
jgi:hypothetical protein